SCGLPTTHDAPDFKMVAWSAVEAPVDPVAVIGRGVAESLAATGYPVTERQAHEAAAGMNLEPATHECPTCGNQEAKEHLSCDVCEGPCCEVCHPGRSTRCTKCESEE
ncbi:MAG: hypothetical protein ACK4K6_18875, partial [Pseudarthrobacter sp.]